MATITLQVYLTDTLTAVSGVSLSSWLADDSSVVDSGVTDGNGQLSQTLGDASYTARGFLSGYTVTETDFTVAVVDATVIVYIDTVSINANTYLYYKDEIINRLGGRNDDKSLALIMSSFNEAQELISISAEWNDLMTSVSGNLTANDGSYSFADLGVTALKDIVALRVNDGTDWKKPLSFITPLDWDTYVVVSDSSSVDDVPKRFTRRLDVVELDPAPDTTYAYNIVARLFPTPVTGDSSVVALTKVDNILINYATGFTWLKLNDSELAAGFITIAEKLLAPYIQDAINNRYAVTRSIGAQKAFGST